MLVTYFKKRAGDALIQPFDFVEHVFGRHCRRGHGRVRCEMQVRNGRVGYGGQREVKGECCDFLGAETRFFLL